MMPIDPRYAISEGLKRDKRKMRKKEERKKGEEEGGKER